jgi:cysteine-rich repeat protein
VNATLSPSLIPAAMGKPGFARCTKFFLLGITDPGALLCFRLCCGFGEGDYNVTLKESTVSSSLRPNAFSGSKESRQFGCGTGSVMCGNGIVEGGEECDDGNTKHDDGCSNQCTITTPTAVCGNGILEGTEECDDGNKRDGDGCDTHCQTEVPFGECDNGLEKVLLRLETDRWSKEDNEMYLFNILDKGTRSAWIWDYPFGLLPSNGNIDLVACLNPGSCYYFEFYDDSRDGLSLEDSNGLLMTNEDGRVLFEIAPDVGGPYSFGRVWIQYLGACSLD